MRSGASWASASSPAPSRAWKNRVRPARRGRAWRVSSLPSPVVTRPNRRFASGETVLAQPDGEVDVVIVEEFQPSGPDELPRRQQQTDRRGRKPREVARDQRDPGAGGAVAGALDHRPDKRDPEAPGHHREHEVIDVAHPDLPGGPVERQHPRPLRPNQSCDERRSPVLARIGVLEEPLQPAIRRGDLHPAPRLAGDMAEVDGARRHHAHHEHAERLQAALAEADMAP